MMQAEDKKDKKKKVNLNSRGVTDEYCLRVSTKNVHFSYSVIIN